MVVSTIFSIQQLNGFFLHPTIKASHCGYYFRLSEGFNLTKYTDYYGMGSENISNGFLFNDVGLFLGKLATISSIIGGILTEDLIVISILIAGLFITAYIIQRGNKYKEWEKNNITYCKKFS